MSRRQEWRPGGMTRARVVPDAPDFRRRGFWLVLAFTAMAVTVSGRLLQVQVVQGPQFAAQAAAEHTSSVTLPAQRGLILDRSGRVLASNRTVFDVFCDPSEVDPSQRDHVASVLAPVLQVSVNSIMHALQQPNRFDYLAKDVSQEVQQRLQQLDIPGVGAIPSEQRVYEPSAVPDVSFASNLLGFVNGDGQGQYGVEQYYDDVLSGVPGHTSTLTDLLGNSIVLSGERSVPARNGDDLELGLDSQIQYWAELALARGVNDAQAQSGTLMIMDPHTGSIRAWAQYPSYDANSYATADIANFRDLGVDQPYEPGSVMKVVTFAGGLENKAITPQTVIDERQTYIDGILIHDWDDRSHGVINMQKVLDLSLNNGAMKVEQLEGQNAFYSNLLDFGIGAPTGVDLAGEHTEPVPPQSSWSAINYATASFGQGVVTTPLEMLAAINAVANGGVWVQPHAVDATVDPSTGKATPFVPRTRRVINSSTAATLAHMMTGVVDDPGAEGYLAAIPGYKGQIAGKTGTASVAGPNGTYDGDVVASFAGFMPATNPQFTMMVILRYPHTPHIPHFGALLAAPVWKQVAQIIIDQWRIRP